MFERYTEKARRVIFYARYEASQFGTPEIESEHLLLGLLREGKGTLNNLLGLQDKEDEIRAGVVAASTQRAKTSTSVDLPLTNECKRILAYGAEEAEGLRQKHIGIEHLLLGVLREEKCFAARLLRERGLQLKKVRMLVETAKDELAADGKGTSQKPTANAALSIRLVDAKTSKVLLVFPGRSRMPRIGESIHIRGAENLSEIYRVQDVVWELEPDHGNPGSSFLRDVQVIVLKEEKI